MGQRTGRRSPVKPWLWQGTGLVLLVMGCVLIGFGKQFASSRDSVAGFAGALFLALILFGVGTAVALSGAHLYNRGRKMRIAPAAEQLAVDPRPPVLYLRSFLDDAEAAEVHQYGDAYYSLATEEEQMVRVLRDLGPVIAVGRPGEELPELGATRLYLGNDEWQDRVLTLMAQARLVVLRAGLTPGFLWEVEHAVRIVPPERLLLMLPFDGDEYATFADRVQRFFPGPLPEPDTVCRQTSWLGPPTETSLCGFLIFDRDWTSTFLPLTRRWNSLTVTLTRPLVPFFRETLRPVLARSGT